MNAPDVESVNPAALKAKVRITSPQEAVSESAIVTRTVADHETALQLPENPQNSTPERLKEIAKHPLTWNHLCGAGRHRIEKEGDRCELCNIEQPVWLTPTEAQDLRELLTNLEHTPLNLPLSAKVKAAKAVINRALTAPERKKLDDREKIVCLSCGKPMTGESCLVCAGDQP